MPILGIIASSISGSKISTASFESIASATGNGSSSTITFSSIPSTYKHLQIRGIARTLDTESDTARYISMQFNSDSSSNYAWHGLYGNQSSNTAEAAISYPTTYGYQRGLSQSTSTSTMGAFIIDIQDYSSTSKNKTVRTFSGVDFNGSGSVNLYSSLWMSTSAISSLTLTSNTGEFSTNTTFALYGIKG
jgi:hypothetical protein